MWRRLFVSARNSSPEAMWIHMVTAYRKDKAGNVILSI